MAHTGRRLFLLLLTLFVSCASGCFGISQNPSYFPYMAPFGDVVRTHAKPIGPAYYENYDPHAVDLAVEPAILTTQVGAQVVILATVRDGKGTPRRHRRVDWLVTNGNLIEVDESGIFNGRGAIDGNRGYSFTNYHEHRLSRGNDNKGDDIMLRPGQSWCVVSSPVEGDTHVQVMVPGIFNWDKRMKTALIRWVDATWEFPPRGTAKFGTEHEFVTKVARHTDRQPLANYRVRYKIIDGPEAFLLPSRAREQTTITDLRGESHVRIAQLTPASGVNRVSVEIIRPPDPTAPSGTGVPIALGETAVDWHAPDVKLTHTGPQTAVLGANVTFTTTITNAGRLENQWSELTLPIPDGLEFVSSQPPSQPSKGEILIPFGVLGMGQTHTVQTTYTTKRPGLVKSVAILKTAEGQNDQKDVDLLVTTPQLKVEILGPQTGLVDVPIDFTIRVTNPGTGDLEQVLLSAEFDKGLEHELKGNVLNVDLKGGVKAGTSRDEALRLTPRQVGKLSVRVVATGGGLKQQAEHFVAVQKPKVSLRVDGPTKRFVSRPAEYKIIVKNEGETDLSGVVVRDRLPPELRYVFASRQGTFASGEVVWNLGNLRGGEEVTLDLTAEAVKSTGSGGTEIVTLLSADGNIRVEKSKRLDIEGRAALKMVMSDENDPVEVGKTVVYRLIITNTGSAPANRIEVRGIVPEQLKPIRAIGPAKEKIVGQVITFEKVDNLQPGAQITFLFECAALKAGDARFRVEYTSDLNAAPLVEEEPTKIFVPFTPGGAIPNASPPVVTPERGPPPPPRPPGKDAAPPVPEPLPKG